MYTVYDENGENEQAVTGIAFTVTSQEIRDGEEKSVNITNTYERETVTLTANKRWASPSGSSISWPAGKSVTFTLGTLDDSNNFTVCQDVSPVTLDNKKDSNGEDTAGSAVFKNLPKYEVVGDAVKRIRYAVKETTAAAGYDLVYPTAGVSYAEFGTENTITIKNQMKSTSVSITKTWDKNMIPDGASATFRLYSYTGDDPSKAEWVSNVNDITLDGVPDSGAVTFGEITSWKADFTGLPEYNSSSQYIHYIVKELRCSPVGYEAVEEYAANNGTITNKPASTTFTVNKTWLGTPSNAWPGGTKITLTLSRKMREGVVDSSFSANYVIASNGIVSQSTIVNPYGEDVQTGVWSGSTLTVSDLQKYDGSGGEWRYYVTESAIQNTANGGDLSGSYSTIYRDKNNYTQSDMTYSGGGITNMLSTRGLTVSKSVSGSLRFTITENENDAAGYQTAYTVNGSTSMTGREATGTLANNPNVAFTNTRQVLIPSGVYDSGINLAAVVPVMLVCTTLLLRRKRTREE